MENRFTLLLVDDDLRVIEAFRRIFQNDHYRLLGAQGGEQAQDLLAENHVDAALIDYQMPGMDGLELLRDIRAMRPWIMVIMVTGVGSVEIAVEAIKAGAVDFIEKPFSNHALKARVAQLYNIWKLRQENQRLKEKADRPMGLENLVGNAPEFQKMKRALAQAAPSEANILILGETGTGKEIAARAVHSLSNRSNQPFVVLDCAAINESILESELFGHEKGAFTGAHTSYQGLARSANKGTLFLDEIGEMPKAIQSKFLRLLQTQVVRPVGSSKTFQVDLRIVCATNRDLSHEVENGNFREDLFYRINVIPVITPPLRKRKDDIALLANHFLARFCSENLVEKRLGKDSIQCLEQYSWPGNVRQLENAIQRATVLSEGAMIKPEDLPAEIMVSSDLPTPVAAAKPGGNTLDAYELTAIENALKIAEGNRKKTAEILQIGEATLYRKLKKYNL